MQHAYDDDLIVDAITLSARGKWRLALGLFVAGAVAVTIAASQMGAGATERVIVDSSSDRVATGPAAPPTTQQRALPAPTPKPTTTTTTTTTTTQAPVRRVAVRAPAPQPTAPPTPTTAAAETLLHPPDSIPAPTTPEPEQPDRDAGEDDDEKKNSKPERPSRDDDDDDGDDDDDDDDDDD